MLTQCPLLIPERVRALGKPEAVTQEGRGTEVQGQNLWPRLCGLCTTRQEEKGAGDELPALEDWGAQPQREQSPSRVRRPSGLHLFPLPDSEG